jgi:ABC-type multidrug transport system permease subunit
MLLYNLKTTCNSTLVLLLIIFVCAGYTYAVNLRRGADDPKKREYHPLAIIAAPFTVLLFLSLGILVFVLRALLFAGFLVIFAILLIGLRKPFLFVLWDRFATKIGDPLLKVNTRLIRMAFGLGTREAEPV